MIKTKPSSNMTEGKKECDAG